MRQSVCRAGRLSSWELASLPRRVALPAIVSVILLLLVTHAFAQSVPSAPANLAAAASTNSVTLTWTPSSGATTYNVYRGTTAGGESATAVRTGWTGSSSSDSGLSSSTAYFYTITALNAAGESGYSAEVSVTTGSSALAAPTGLKAIAGSGQATVAWKAVTGATTYNLYRNSVLAQTGISGTSATDTGLTNSTTYTYTVAAVKATGQGTLSAGITATPGVAPLSAPTGLTGTPGSSQVSLAWNGVSGATTYNVYRSTTSGGEGTSPYGSASGTTFSDYPITNGTTYYYQVAAVTANGEGALSAEAQAIPGTPLAAPLLKAVASGGSVSLSWGAVTGATSYNLYRYTSAAGWTLYQQGLTASPYSDTAVVNGTAYQYQVAASNATGQGSKSNTASANPGSTPLAAPSGISVAPGTASATIYWMPVTGASSYNLYRSTTSGGEGSVPIAAGLTGGQYADSGLAAATTYYYQIAAVNANSEGALSAEGSGTTGQGLAAPSGLKAISASAQVALSWGSVAGAASYNLYRGIAAATPTLYQSGLTAASYTDTGLTNGTVYTYYVAAVNTGGQGASSATVSGTPGGTAPAAPTGLAGTPASGTVALTWNAVSGAASYNVYRATTSGGEGAVPIKTGAGGTSWSNTGLTDGITYYYQVSAVSSVGEGALSTEAQAISGAPLTAPVIKAVGGSAQITLSWTTISGATSYNLYRTVGGVTVLYQAGLTSAAYTNTGLTNGTSYAYQAAAVNATGQGTLSNTASATPGGTALAAPANLAASAGSNSVGLYWTAVTGATSYNLYRSTVAGGEGSAPVTAGIGYAPSPSSPYTDSSAVNGTAYYYKVAAVSSAGEGGLSNEASATPGSAQLPAPVLKATAGSAQVSLAWTGLSGAASYNIYRYTSAAGWIVLQLGVSAASYTDTAVSNGTNYTYEVAGVNAGGQGAFSNTATATPGSAALAAPGGLTATPGVNLVTLSWNAVSGASSYNVYRSTTAGGEGASPVAVGAGTSYASYTDNNLVNNTTYYYKVAAVAAAGEGALSGEVSATPGGTLLAAPSLRAVAGATQIVLTWTPISGATSYTLYRGPYGSAQSIYQQGIAASAYTDTAVTLGTTYTYYVVAANANGFGNASNTANAKAGSTPLPATAALTVAPASSTSVTLTWAAVTGATAYDIYRSTTAGGEGSVPIATGASTPYTDSNLASGTTYYYQVAAVNTTGEGTLSNEAAATPGNTVPAAPVLKAVAGSAQVTLSWSAVSGAASYILYRSTASTPTSIYLMGLSSGSQTYTDGSLTNGTLYNYQIAAVNTSGLGTVSNQARATPGASALPAVAGLAATPGAGQVVLTWTAVSGATSYNVYRSTSAGGEGSVPAFAGVSTTGSTYTDTAVSNTVTYYYKVAAVSTLGEGALSGEASATPGSAGLPAPLLKAVPGASQVALTWTAVAGAATYTVYRGTSSSSLTVYQPGVSSATYVDTGVTGSTTYYYQVAAVTAAGQGALSNRVSATPGASAPAAPTGLTATAVYGGTQIALSWNAVSGATSYNIYRATAAGAEGGAPYLVAPTVTLTSGVDTYTDSPLVTGVTYYYQVSAVAANGESALSGEAGALAGGISLPAPILKAVAGASQVNLSWTAIPGASSYVLYRGATSSTLLAYQGGLTAAGYSDSGVTAGTLYYYQVTAVNGSGLGSASNKVAATPGGAVPAAPTGLVATAANASVTLTWSTVTSATSYNLYRSTSPGGEGAVPYIAAVSASISGGVATYTDSSLTNSVVYYYEVCAVNAVGEGPLSAEASAVPGSAQLAAPKLKAVAGSAQAALSWTQVAGATGYALYRGPSSGSMTFYQTVTAGASYTDTGLTNGTALYYQVSAINQTGQGGKSNTAVATPGGTAPAAPTGLVATAGASSIALTWNTVTGATSYNVYRSATSGGEGAAPIATGVTSASWSDSTPAAGATCYYQVTAVSAVGEGALSNEAGATVNSIALATPMLKADAGSAQAILSWTSVPGATSYVLYRGPTSGSLTAYQVGITASGYTDAGLTNGTAYYYQVSAVNAGGAGGKSNTVAVTPGSAPLSAPTLTVTGGNASTSLSWTAVTGATSYNIYRATATGAEGAAPYKTTAGTSYMDTGLTNGVTYFYQAAAANANGEGALSGEGSATPGGTAPLTPVVKAVAGNTLVTVSWSASPGATSYTLLRSTGVGTPSSYQTGLTAVTFSDTGLTNGTVYNYQVTATGSGGTSVASNKATATPGSASPGAPSLAATAGNQAVALTWSAVSGATSYNLYRSTASGAEGAAPLVGALTGTTYTNTGLTNGQTYYYQVSAMSASGEGASSNEADAAPGSPLLAAPNLSASPGASQAGLAWTAVPGATAYNIYRGPTSSTLTLYQPGVTGSSYIDTGVTAGQTYYYQVAGTASASQGSLSNTVSAIPGGSVLAAPAGLTATAGTGSVNLSWNGVSGASSYNLYRGLSAGGEGAAPFAINISSASYSDSAVSYGTAYYYFVTALNTTGESGASNEASATPGSIALGAPVLKAVAGASQVALSWTAISGASGYVLYRRVGAGSFSVYQSGVTGASYTDTAVTAGTAYSYTVAAVNASGEGTVSNTVNATPGGALPGAPTLVARTYGSSVSLAWNTVSGATSYNIYRATASGGEGAAPIASTTSVSYIDASVVKGVVYYYQVAAVNAASEGPLSNESSATANTAALPAPAGLKAVAGSTQVAVSWSPVPRATSYNLYRAVGAGSLALYQLGLTAPSYTDTAVTSGTVYTYAVSAANADGEGTQSGAVKATPGSAALGATLLSALAGSGYPYGTGIQLSWNSVSGALSYNIYRGTAAGGEGSSPYLTGTTSSPYTDSSVTSGVTYFYRVAPVNAVGEGSLSNEASATSGVTVLAAPTGLKATAGSAQVALAWNTVTGATGYNLYRGIGAGTPVLYQLGLTAASYTDTGLTNGTAYTYTVTAVNGNGAGASSASVTATPGSAALAAPVLAAAPGNGSVALSWNTIAGATSYNVYRATAAGAEGATPYLTGITSVAYTDSGLTNGVTYFYTVTAVNGLGEGAQSNEASAVVNYAPPAAPSLKGIAGNTQASLSWSAVPGATSYVLLRSIGGANPTPYATGLTGTSYVDTGLPNGGYRKYQVAAVNGAGQGPLSNLVYVTPGPPGTLALAAPTLAGTGSDRQSYLLWSAVDGATSYNIYRSTVAGGEGAAPYVTGVGSAVVDISYADMSVSNGVTYYYQVAAVNNNGEGAYSNEVTVQPPNPIADFIPCGNPPVLTVTRGSSAAMMLAVGVLSGFSGMVTLTVGTLPAGVTATPFPYVCTTSGSNLTFCAASSATPGDYYVNLIGTSGSISHTLVIHLIVN